MSGALHKPRYTRFRKLITEARKESGLTQADLSIKLRRPQSFVSKYESGERRLDVIEFLEICDALDVNPAAILHLLSTGGSK